MCNLRNGNEIVNRCIESEELLVISLLKKILILFNKLLLLLLFLFSCEVRWKGIKIMEN